MDDSSGVSGFNAEALVERAPLGLGVIGPDGRFQFVNPALVSVLGRPRQDVAGAEAVSFLIEEEREPARATLALLLGGRLVESRTDRHYVRADGTVVLARLVTAAVIEPGGAVSGVVVLLEDVTRERATVAAQTELAALIGVLDEAVYSLDADGRLRSWNAAAERLFGWRHQEALGQHIFTLAPADRQAEQRAWLARLAEGETVRADTVRLRSDGTPVDVSLTITPVLDPSGRLTGAIGVAHDIGERKQATDRLRYLARHDPVTGLANRRWFTERLYAALERSGAGAGQVGVLFIDLDRFKEVNDRYGHDIGDQYLRVIGARMLAALRPSDLLARWGGDEYAAIVEHLHDRDTLLRVADRVQHALSGPVRVGNASLPVRASIGVAASGQDVSDDQLLRAADAAMYTAKRLGGGQTATAWRQAGS